MATFERFDVCIAYYWYAVLHNGTGKAARIHTRLARIGFKPSINVQFGRLSENAQDIYDGI